MKTTFKLIALGTSLSLASLAAQAQSVPVQDTFVGLTWGESSSNIDRSSKLKNSAGSTTKLDDVINNSSTWGVRGGVTTDLGRAYLTYENVSDKYSNRYKLRQENLLGSYDMFLPVGADTNLFGGVTLGMTKLTQTSSGYHRDRDYDLSGGLQAGILHRLAPNASVEAGYRYLRTRVDTKLNARDGSTAGSFDLKSTEQAYVGLNYHF